MVRQRPFFLLRARQQRVHQPPRPTGDERQRGRNHRVRRALQHEQLCKRDAKHRAGFHVAGQLLRRRAIDQRIDIDHPAQRFGHDRDRKGTIGTAQPRRRSMGCEVERIAAAQDRIDQA
jgi:hypothetical protein